LLPCLFSVRSPDAINAAGTIAGWYTNNYYNSPACKSENTGGFVRSPDGELTQPPGTMAEFLEHLPEPGYTPWPHWISIDQAGDITGFYTDAAGVQHGFVRNPYGTITSFDPPEGNETNPTSISDGVAIVRGAGLRLALSAYRSGLAENFQPAE
jgi:hypothetical protein